MEFKFDANQEFQINAIAAVTGLFEGQPRNEASLTFASSASFAAVANRLDLDEGALLANLQSVQEQNGVAQDPALQCIEETIETAAGPKAVRFPNFSIEMETGTGKTYVYLRTVLDLNGRYGLRKFIVVVPSVAIREGVLKTLAITEKHLKELYGNPPYRYYIYDSENLSLVRQFALSDGIEIMVMTIDSFNKASNVIRQTTDRLQGETPIHLVQAARPILILDEPQNMESELRVKALAALDPLFALRYSATPRNPYNLVYRLTPFEAYRQGLVKRIEVVGVEEKDNANLPFLRLDDIRSEKKTLTARLAVHKLMKDSSVKEQVVVVRPGDNLEGKANRSEYADFTVDEISLAGGFVRFSNGVELRKGEAQGADKEAIFEAQIRFTIQEHFQKQQRLKEAGIKVLSLFFIDRVDNYAQVDGVIRRLFYKCFNELQEKYPYWKGIDPEKVQAAYFAQRRTKTGEVIFEDSKTGEAEKDREAYNLIMKDKERLLAFEEPTCFIFSHSALREGWDNPNVFQICTLNQTASEVKKRQEVGRGMRLAVNRSGDRVHDERVNILTVVANQSYQSYVERLQTEIQEEYGVDGAPPPPPNARKRGVARLRKAYTLKPEFKELWERIKHKTRYAVTIDTEKLLAEVVEELDRAEIRKPHIAITKAQVQVGAEGTFEAMQMSGAKNVLDLAGRYPLPNLVAIMENLMERTTPPMRLTRRTLLEVFRRAKNKQAALDNPHEFALVAVGIIKRKLADHLVNGIQYEKINEWYEMTQLADIPSYEEYLVPSQRPDGSDGASLYDQVVWESEIEKQFVEDMEKRDDVKLYLKLPSWFTVPTPVGEYNPDWAIVMEERDEHGQPTGKSLLYLVRETKAENWKTALRPDELRKITCGERHFRDALKVDYKVVTKAADLP
ncbi:MAG: DEAD/DEAH box helicase family protein [Dehalococcoidia bacterium]|nr:DEAD/DEAH box helicase family protein [Dehalococcoidia bacterium]